MAVLSEAFADDVEIGQDIALRDQEGVILGTMTVTDKWVPNKAREAEMVFGADDSAHPAVNYLHNEAGAVYLGGPVVGIQQPVHYDFRARRDTPNEMRAYFRKLGWRKIVAFQTRNPLHRAHQELTFRAAKEAQANLLIHPVVGLTKPGDIDHFTRVRCYEAVLDQYPASTTAMSLLNLAMRMAGPREAVWHVTILNISGTELRRRLNEGLEIPEWFSFPTVVEELRKTRPERSKQGFTVFFTGFSGSGKSTIANALMVKLMEMGGRPVTLLDGDLVRKNLSSELGFSKEHRDLNIRRIGYVASEITKNGGIKEFTGISDPYDVPENPELSVETENVEVDNCAHSVILKLESMGLIKG